MGVPARRVAEAVGVRRDLRVVKLGGGLLRPGSNPNPNPGQSWPGPGSADGEKARIAGLVPGRVGAGAGRGPQVQRAPCKDQGFTRCRDPPPPVRRPVWVGRRWPCRRPPPGPAPADAYPADGRPPRDVRRARRRPRPLTRRTVGRGTRAPLLTGAYPAGAPRLARRAMGPSPAETHLTPRAVLRRPPARRLTLPWSGRAGPPVPRQPAWRVLPAPGPEAAATPRRASRAGGRASPPGPATGAAHRRPPAGAANKTP